jgi:hypothetical protein
LARRSAIATVIRQNFPSRFSLCTTLKEAPGLIGQDRAVEALSFALRMRGKGYNVYALGAGAPAATASLNSVASFSVADLRSPPGRRTQFDSCRSDSSRKPRPMVLAAIPLAADTAAIPT